MKLVLLAVCLLNINNLRAHNLEEAKKMVELGAVDLSELVIKFSENPGTQKGVFNIWAVPANKNFEETDLFSPKSTHQKGVNSDLASKLNSYSSLSFNQELRKEEALVLLESISAQYNIDYAFFAPKFEEAFFNDPDEENETETDVVEVTPDFEPQQDYLLAAPTGIDAVYAWTQPGGTGKNIRIIDIETGVNFEHEDFEPMFYMGELPAGKVDHGTAVWGELSARRDGIGVTGIVHESQYGFMSRLQKFGEEDYHTNIAKVIEHAVDNLEAGDVLVLEMHSPGPRGSYIPVEYWEPIYDVLKLAEAKGVLCAAAGGNGYEDLDHEDYEGAFDLAVRNSGCVIVGAANREKEKEGFSNFGARVDAFGYGSDVVTAGYGNLYDGGENKKYTKRFSGTSSATPIVSGAIAALSSIAQEQGRLLSSQEIREALRATGTPQSGDTTKRVGNFPDLRELISYLGLE